MNSDIIKVFVIIITTYYYEVMKQYLNESFYSLNEMKTFLSKESIKKFENVTNVWKYMTITTRDIRKHYGV